MMRANEIGNRYAWMTSPFKVQEIPKVVRDVIPVLPKNLAMKIRSL
jgi:hypothetical protein